MKAIEMGEHETRIFRAPDNWNEAEQGQCGALSICDIRDHRGNWMISSWELEPGDIEKLQAGQPISLAILGTVHPVVSVYIGGENHG